MLLYRQRVKNQLFCLALGKIYVHIPEYPLTI